MPAQLWGCGPASWSSCLEYLELFQFVQGHQGGFKTRVASAQISKYRLPVSYSTKTECNARMSLCGLSISFSVEWNVPDLSGLLSFTRRSISSSANLFLSLVNQFML